MIITPNFTSLAGKFLIAMPHISDPRFHRAVIFICAHDPNGAMGLMLTSPKLGKTMDNLMEELGIPHDNAPHLGRIPLLAGGPIEDGRGFVLHSPDFHRPETVVVNDDFAVTGTIDGLKDIGAGNGPEKLTFALGYAAWQAGQLENELKGNAWLLADATQTVVFEIPAQDKWDVVMHDLGINPAMISGTLGHA
jgi:putative transcriptional regulator